MLLFLKLKFYSRVINELAGATFTCYLFHGDFINMLGIREAVKSEWYLMIIHQVIVCVGMYIMSCIVFKIYHLCTNWFIRIVVQRENR